MNKDTIMALADAYAAATSEHIISGASDAEQARAALEAALTEKQEPVYRLLDWIINECVIYPESDDEKQFAKRLLDAITHPKSGYTHPAPVNQPSVRVGHLRISRHPTSGIWLRHDNGEAMQTDEDKLYQHLSEYWHKEF